MLIWYRDSRNTWQTELRDGMPPEVISGKEISLAGLTGGRKIRQISVYDPWKDIVYDVGRNPELVLPDFSRSIVVRVKYR